MRQGMMSDERNAGELVGAPTRIERATRGLEPAPALSDNVSPQETTIQPTAQMGQMG